MKSIRTAIIVSVGLIVALWWAVLPPRFAPRPLPRLDPQQQCTGGSILDGKQCVCPAGTAWKDARCVAQ